MQRFSRRPWRRAVGLALGVAATLHLAGSAGAADPVRVLVLDYNLPTENDVLVSHLCVDRCTTANGCPEALIAAGVDYWSDQFVVSRPRYLGRSARFIVNAYKDRRIDLLSFAGHHASGFTGDYGRGRFDTEQLGVQLAGRSDVEPFFTHPTMVLLQGCRTDVKSRFDGDPVEYVRHVIEETRVREDEFERLLAAVQQIGGVQQAYRDLFPNACLLGYRGTQAPGSRMDVYGQVTGFLRRLGPEPIAPRFDLGRARQGWEEAQALNRRIEQECPNGWPCNLCRTAPAYYGPLAANLAALLRHERQRVKAGRPHTPREVVRLETTLEKGAFYHNTRWSCSLHRPGTRPVWPDPVDESPFGRLFLSLLWLDVGELDGAQRREFRNELVHRLGTITFTEIDRLELRVWLHSEANWQWLQDFLAEPLLSLSTYRQQDFFAFLANIACRDCLELVFDRQLPSILRENAAGKLHPELGPELYLRALGDDDPRVGRAAAKRLQMGSAPEVLRAAAEHPDPEIRRTAAAKVWAWAEALLRVSLVP